MGTTTSPLKRGGRSSALKDVGGKVTQPRSRGPSERKSSASQRRTRYLWRKKCERPGSTRSSRRKKSLEYARGARSALQRWLFRRGQVRAQVNASGSPTGVKRRLSSKSPPPKACVGFRSGDPDKDARQPISKTDLATLLQALSRMPQKSEAAPSVNERPAHCVKGVREGHGPKNEDDTLRFIGDLVAACPDVPDTGPQCRGPEGPSDPEEEVYSKMATRERPSARSEQSPAPAPPQVDAPQCPASDFSLRLKPHGPSFLKSADKARQADLLLRFAKRGVSVVEPEKNLFSCLVREATWSTGVSGRTEISRAPMW
eukprot:CAMPEP_0194485310 /NCGR_PEP_ID=MMETSP0253-20130528/6354_1 /TAXON_ID=2966 /ORGANISM="Noctiluca scintillans" /LENGTH=314 /DNA_ID=CAMNT_0039325275 /DNA_START=38 /DNA_END=979 /DNA_ORIENTATION=-